METPHKAEQQKMLQAQVNCHTHETENSLRGIMFLSILKRTELANRLSSGFLITSGAIASLLLPNLATLDPVIPARVSMYFLYCVLASSIFGLIQKFCAVNAILAGETVEEFAEKFGTVLTKHNGAMENAQTLAGRHGLQITLPGNPASAFTPVINEFPWPIRWIARRAMRKGESDSMYPIRRGMRFFRGCFWAGIAQSLTFAGGFLYMLVNIKTP